MRSSRVVLSVPVLLAASALSWACQQQGEGDVCDPRAANGGSADCQVGLVCTAPTQLAAGTQGWRCCPGDPALATGVCAESQSLIPMNPAVPSSDAAADGSADGDLAGDAAPLDSSVDTDATEQ